MMMFVFIHRLVGRVFKILPLREAEERGEEVFLQKYLDSLVCDMKGAIGNFPELGESAEYVDVLNTVQYLRMEKCDVDRCKEKVFGALRLLNAMEDKMGGEHHGNKLYELL